MFNKPIVVIGVCYRSLFNFVTAGRDMEYMHPDFAMAWAIQPGI